MSQFRIMFRDLLTVLSGRELRELRGTDPIDAYYKGIDRRRLWPSFLHFILDIYDRRVDKMFLLYPIGHEPWVQEVILDAILPTRNKYKYAPCKVSLLGDIPMNLLVKPLPVMKRKKTRKPRKKKK